MSEGTAALVGLLGAIILCGSIYIAMNVLFWTADKIFSLYQNRGGGKVMRIRNKHRAKLGLPKLK